MLTMSKNNFGNVLNLEQYANDGRLTEPSNGIVYDYRKMNDVVQKLHRPLTVEEAEKYRIK